MSELTRAEASVKRRGDLRLWCAWGFDALLVAVWIWRFFAQFRVYDRQDPCWGDNGSSDCGFVIWSSDRALVPNVELLLFPLFLTGLLVVSMLMRRSTTRKRLVVALALPAVLALIGVLLWPAAGLASPLQQGVEMIAPGYFDWMYGKE